MEELYIVDRIEGNIAVFETNNDCTINIKIEELGFSVKEGDVLIKVNGKYVFSECETEKRKQCIETKVNDMWEE